MKVGPESRLSLVRRALAGHAALGLLAATLLYVIALTGTLAVVHDRWQRWEQPAVPEFTDLSPSAAQAAITAALSSGQDGVRTKQFSLQMPTDDFPRAIVSSDAGAWYIDNAGRRIARVDAGWTEFVVALHERLLLPASWGYALIGAFGVALASLALTGVLAHPRIVRDAFRLRWRQGPHIARVDWHNRLGVWTLPFAIAIALTGAVLGLSTIGFTLLADIYHGGSLERAYEPLFGAQPVPDAGVAPIPDVGAALIAMRTASPSVKPVSITVPAPGTRGQEIQVLATHPHRLIYGETYRFDDHGHLLGRARLSDGPAGQQAVASVYGLHFGNYGGVAVELAYLLFGTALCVVTATGPSIWLHKRRRRGLASPRLSATWDAAVWGTPLLLILCWWFRIVTHDATALTAFFVLGLVAGTATAAVKPNWIALDSVRTVSLAFAASTGLAHFLLFKAAAGPRAIDAILMGLPAVAFWTLQAMRLSSSSLRSSGLGE